MLGPNIQYMRTARMLAKVVTKSFGQLDRECTICGHKGRFVAEIHFPDVFRFDALCPHCISLPRTRLLWLAIKRDGLVGPKDDLLHFAPERSLIEHIRKVPGRYRTADLMDPVADLKLNIEQIDLPDNEVDVIICSHVLEHVKDHLAIAELYRILKPGGRLLAMVPMVDGWEQTYENSRPLDRAERRFHYGRTDHFRRYGADFVQRLEVPGFRVERSGADGDDSVRYGLSLGESVFVCHKPAG